MAAWRLVALAALTLGVLVGRTGGSVSVGTGGAAFGGYYGHHPWYGWSGCSRRDVVVVREGDLEDLDEGPDIDEPGLGEPDLGGAVISATSTEPPPHSVPRPPTGWRWLRRGPPWAHFPTVSAMIFCQI